MAKNAYLNAEARQLLEEVAKADQRSIVDEIIWLCKRRLAEIETHKTLEHFSQ